MDKRGQRGDGKLGCILGLAVLVVAVIVAIKVVPLKIAVAELADFSTRQAERAALPGATDANIRDAILEKAKTLRLPLAAENIKVSRTTRDITITYRFEMDVKLPLYTYRWKVDREIVRPLIFV